MCGTNKRPIVVCKITYFFGMIYPYFLDRLSTEYTEDSIDRVKADSDINNNVDGGEDS